jgi:predicted alpha/beta hydrolase family esterase
VLSGRGHLNSASRLSDWPAGLELLDDLRG